MSKRINSTRKAARSAGLHATAAGRGEGARASDHGEGAAATDEGGVEIRARILDAARRHFFSLGFAGCTMDCLARELGMSKKTVYRHFRSKEAIVDELMRAKSAAIRDGFEAVLVLPDLTFAERASRMMQHVLTQVSEISAIFLHDLRRFHPAAYARLEEFRARVAPGIWERLLRLGMEAGAVRGDVDPVFIGRLIPVVMQSLLHPDTLERLALQPHEMAQRFFHLLFCGVLTPEGLAEHAQHTTTRH
jgi:AcrR family transcriptional regulator